MKDYYKILEVNESASIEVINVAYKTLVKRYHPDLVKETEKKMKEEKMKDLNLAKDVLGDPVKRSRYDIELKQESERRLQEEINERVHNFSNTNSGNNNKYKLKKHPKKKEITENPISMVGNSFKSYFSLFSNFNRNKGLIIICSGLFVVAFLQIFLVWGYSFKTPNNNAISSTQIVSPLKSKELAKINVGLSKDEVITMFGKPDDEYSAYLKYGDAKILLQGNYIVGWIDTYKQLPIIRHTKVPSETTLKIGTNKDTVINSFGTPDTYSRDLLVYDDVMIYLEKDIVTGIDYVQK